MMNAKQLLTGILIIIILSACRHKPKKTVKVGGVNKGSLTETVKQPIYSANLARKKIPESLKNITVAYQAPSSCDEFLLELELLNEALGVDYIDKENVGSDVFRLNLGQMLTDEVEASIPFNSIVKRLSGARKHEKATLSAQVRGKARRSYLKGWADAKGCKVPEEPAEEVIEDQTKK